ncbi:MAG: NAD-dependent epimerase/dehydratase family protein [Planctomycetes bacterium]|nr:NAD-dependent epimerase/dehydratase family protein [Planctomycetota bacterium]
MTRPRTVLLTGGAGFLGVHLTRALLARGDRVTVLDDLSAPSPLGLPRHRRLLLQCGDVRDRRAVERAFAGVDAALHLAAPVGVERVLADPGRVDSVVRDGTGVVLEVARRHGTPLVAFSSSEVTDAPRGGPRAIYAEAKRDAEALLLQSGGCLPLTVLRPFNVVGRGQSAPGAVLPALATRARRGAELPVHGDGRQERSFVHVSDLVAALLRLLERPAHDRRELLELGGTVRTSMGELAGRLARLAGRGATVRPFAACGPREDLPRRAPDLGALRAAIPFVPRVGLDAMLREALADA